MLDIAEELVRWCERGRDFAVATVVAVTGSAPREPGAALAVDTAGEAVGSVSGGCVEGAVYERCREVLETGETVLERFGYSDEDAFAVGLTCGGVIDILVTPVRVADGPLRETLAAALEESSGGGPVALARVTEGPPELLGRALLVRGEGRAAGTLDGPDAPGGADSDAGPPPSGTHQGGRAAPDGASAGDGVARAGGVPGGSPTALERTVLAEARALLDAGRTAAVTVGADGSLCGQPVTLLVEVSVPPPRMIIFGAIDHAAALARAGSFLGYHVTVCDARTVFATRQRFPGADEVVVDWPHRYLDSQQVDSRTALCVLTHDAKFDVPLLERALRLPVAYVGAMGSRRTHEDRLARLRAAGLTEGELARLRSPIGLDLGARTPEETALSIAAEIVALRRGGSGAPLIGAHTPIHHEPGPAPAGNAAPDRPLHPAV